MKKKVIAITITLLVATAGALTLVQCDHSNMARVTIHIQNDLYAQKSESIIDKILKLVSTRVYAMENAWSDHTTGNILLTISAPDMATIETTIAPTQSSFTTEVPAGTQRTIRLVYDNGESIYEPHKPHGAQKTVNLTPGDNDVLIQLLPMTEIDSIYGTDYDVELSWYGVSLAGEQTISYNIFRSTSPNKGYDKINLNPETSTSYLDSHYESELIDGTTYYYRVSVITDGQEGLLSEDYGHVTYVGP